MSNIPLARKNLEAALSLIESALAMMDRASKNGSTIKRPRKSKKDAA